MADTVDLKSTAVMREGSNPSTPTNLFDISTEQDYILHIGQRAIELMQEIDFLCGQSPEWITQKDAFEMLGVSHARLSKMVQDNILRGIKGYTNSWVLKADVDARIAYIEKHGKPTRGKHRKD